MLSEAVGDDASASRKTKAIFASQSDIALRQVVFFLSPFHRGNLPHRGKRENEEEAKKQRSKEARKQGSKEEIRLIGDYYEPNEIY